MLLSILHTLWRRYAGRTVVVSDRDQFYEYADQRRHWELLRIGPFIVSQPSNEMVASNQIALARTQSWSSEIPPSASKPSDAVPTSFSRPRRRFRSHCLPFVPLPFSLIHLMLPRDLRSQTRRHRPPLPRKPHRSRLP